MEAFLSESYMSKKLLPALSLIFMIMVLVSAGCSTGQKQFRKSDKTFADLGPDEQEKAYDYRLFFQPKPYGPMIGYVGDTMPYYENGIFYIYYLKDGGGSFNHSIYLASTKDFVDYTEYEDPILEANYDGGQDGWIGTGSVVKVGEDYDFFYTAHASAGDFEYKEKIMAARGRSLTDFKKIDGWELIPSDDLGQKNDFRDPQAYYDAESDKIILTVTAAKDGIARILRYTLMPDLSEAIYDGIIFTDPTGEFWNLECSDTFCMNGRCYLTYSGQDDTLWYASSENRYGPYSEPQRLDGKIFYAAKHVEDRDNVYMAGWARRSESLLSAGPVTGWGGNMLIQQVEQASDGSLYLKPPESIVKIFTSQRPIQAKKGACIMEAGDRCNFVNVFTAYERFMITGKFSFSGDGSFGMAFDFGSSPEDYKLISLDPEKGKLQLLFGNGGTLIAEKSLKLVTGRTYAFTYLQEGSVGVFYVDGQAALTVRLYGISGKPIRLFAQNNNVSFSDLAEFTD